MLLFKLPFPRAHTAEVTNGASGRKAPATVATCSLPHATMFDYDPIHSLREHRDEALGCIGKIVWWHARRETFFEYVTASVTHAHTHSLTNKRSQCWRHRDAQQSIIAFPGDE
jgi:hypothetical protein